MAISFSIADLPTLANLVRAHPNPVGFWTWVRARTNSSDLQEVADKFILDWNVSGEVPVATVRRLADAVQELQAVTQEIELIREEDIGQGKTITGHVKYTASSV